MNLLKTVRRKVKIWVIKELFKFYFPHYFYPFETANERFLSMSKPDKMVYGASINMWVNSKAFKNESEELIRSFYSKLALESNDEIQVAAYRMSLIFMRDSQKRLEQFSKQYKSLI